MTRLVIGGKSLGGRRASLLADEVEARFLADLPTSGAGGGALEGS